MLIERERHGVARASQPHAPCGDQERRADRLRPLPVRVRRQQHVLLRRRPIGEPRDERRRLAQQRGPLVAHVQPQIERDLVVARPGRMEPRSDRPDALAELALDGHVHVFFAVREDEGAGGGLVVQLAKGVAKGARVGYRDDARVREHRDVRRAADEVFAGEGPVVIEGGGPGEELGKHPPGPGRVGARDTRHERRLVWMRGEARGALSGRGGSRFVAARSRIERPAQLLQVDDLDPAIGELHPALGLE